MKKRLWRITKAHSISVIRKHATLTYWLLWAKGTWEIADTRKALCPFYFWKQGIELPCERCPPWTRRKEDNLITREGESRPREICTNFVKLTLIFLSTSPQYTIPSPNPSVLSILHKLFLCLKSVEAFCSGHVFSSSFSHEGSYMHMKI